MRWYIERAGERRGNVISHAEQVADVTALIEAEPLVTSALVPIGAGLRVVVKEPGSSPNRSRSA